MASSEDRYESWARWLKSALKKQRLSQAEFGRRYRLLGPDTAGFADTTVSRWLKPEHRLGPSPKSALRAAEVLHASPVGALRAAGHGDVADILDEYTGKLGAPAGPAPTHPAIDATVSMIRESGLPDDEKEALREDYGAELDGDLELLKATIARRIARLSREIDLGERILDGEDNGHTKHTA